jgi:propionate catabolism operon transcriptional regulator
MSGLGGRKVVILLVGYRKFSELIHTVMPEFVDEAIMTTVECIAKRDTEYDSLVAQHKPDVVASAGSNAAFLASTLSVPVVGQSVTDIDVIEALVKAQRISRRVHLFSYQPGHLPPSRLLQSLSKLLSVDFVYHLYSTTGQAKEALQLALIKEQPQVVIGSSYICDLAEQQGVPTILIYSKESARQLLRDAIEVGRILPAILPPEKVCVAHERFVICSPVMEQIQKLAQTYALSSGAVLIEGDSGTGKEHITKEIHHHSKYRDGSLVPVNCGTIPDELFESEFFGYVDGAFTGSRRGGRKGLVEQANGGVLYLDEVGEMPPGQQVKLLRVLQEKRVRPVGGNSEIPLDFKLIAATNCDLRAAVSRGDFRVDLYYRLSVFSMKLPPLRERHEDIEGIARHYFNRYAQEYGASIDINSSYDAVADKFHHYHWPGNVRELQNFVERLVVNCLSQGYESLDSELVDQVLPELNELVTHKHSNSGSLRDQEEKAIRSAMQQFLGDKKRVAEQLGMSTTTLWRRLSTMTRADDELPE